MLLKPRLGGSSAVLVAALLVALVHPVSMAQSAKKTGKYDLEEVLVTARKKTESLSETPVAITAFNDLQLSQKSIQGMQDIAYLTPGLTYESYVGGNVAAPTIRGMNQAKLNNREQNVSTFIDGIYLQSQGNIDVSLLDLDRVEVIKGPQSSLYGRNSFAGAINYITRRPGVELRLKVEATTGSDGREDWLAALEVPVNDWLAFNVSTNDSGFDGTFKNSHPNAGLPGLLDDDLGGWDKEGSIYGLYVDPLDSLSLVVRHYDFESLFDPFPFANTFPDEYPEMANCGQYTQGTREYAVFCGTLDLDHLKRATRINTVPVTSDGMPVDPRAERSKITTKVTSGTVQYTIAELVTISLGYSESDLTNGNLTAVNGDQIEGTAASGFFGGTFPPEILPPASNIMVFFAIPVIEQRAEQWELRFASANSSPLQWSFGAYLSTVEETSEGVFSVTEPPRGTDPVDRSQLLVLQSSEFADRIEAVFGAGEYAFSDQLTLNVELRRTAEHKDVINKPSALTPTASATIADEDFDYITWRIITDYIDSRENLWYASLANGVKGGGFNADGTAYDEESNITLEFGHKLTRDRLRGNIAVFYTDWTDLQISVPDSAGSPVSVTGNLDGGAVIYGLEIDGQYSVFDGTRVDLGLALNHTEFSDDAVNNSLAQACGANTVCSIYIGGNEMPRQSDVTWNLGLLQQGELFWGIDYFARLDAIYQSKQWMGEANIAQIEERKLLNFRTGLHHAEQGWSLDFWVKNLLDRDYVSNAIVVNGSANVRQNYGPVLGMRKTTGFTLKYEFM